MKAEKKPMTTTLMPETENRLADALIANGLPKGEVEDDTDALSEADIADMQAGIKRGLEAAAAGRVKPQVQAIAEAHQRHGFSETWVCSH